MIYKSLLFCITSLIPALQSSQLSSCKVFWQANLVLACNLQKHEFEYFQLFSFLEAAQAWKLDDHNPLEELIQEHAGYLLMCLQDEPESAIAKHTLAKKVSKRLTVLKTELLHTVSALQSAYPESNFELVNSDKINKVFNPVIKICQQSTFVWQRMYENTAFRCLALCTVATGATLGGLFLSRHKVGNYIIKKIKPAEHTECSSTEHEDVRPFAAKLGNAVISRVDKTAALGLLATAAAAEAATQPGPPALPKVQATAGLLAQEGVELAKEVATKQIQKAHQALLAPAGHTLHLQAETPQEALAHLQVGIKSKAMIIGRQAQSTAATAVLFAPAVAYVASYAVPATWVIMSHPALAAAASLYGVQRAGYLQKPTAYLKNVWQSIREPFGPADD